MAKDTSHKQTMIDDANKRVVIVTSIAAFVVIFCLVASHALFSQLLYQNRIVTAKKQALSQLKTDTSAIQNLDTAYAAFVGTPQNVLGGLTNGSNSQDGDNAKVILDALPSKYDFPALATSLEKILTSENIQIQSISGTDDEVAQSAKSSSATPAPQPIPFSVTGTSNYQSIQNMTKTFESSIRPIQIQTLTLSGGDATLTASITAQTYYQPEKTFSIGTKVIK